MKRFMGTLVAGLLLLTGCGTDPDAEAADAAAAAEASRSAAEEAEDEELAARAQEVRERNIAEDQAAYDECAKVVAPLRNSLEELNSRLSVGLNVGDYSTRVGDARVAYDQVVPKISDTDPKCVESAIKLENAYNEYVKGINRWQECIDDLDCDFEDSDLGRQTQEAWRKAGQMLDRSSRTMEKMQPYWSAGAAP